MFTVNPKQLFDCRNESRLWQGIPGIEVTRSGRMFIAFYTGGTREQVGNYVLLFKSDNGVNFGEPIAAALPDMGHRCYDPCLWIDPLGRLWVIWADAPEHSVRAVICDDPDADDLRFGEERIIGHNVMMNKPTVLTSGEWLFPMAVWDTDVRAVLENDKANAPGSYAYLTTDCGETFVPYGKADVPDRSFDEHMILEKSDGVLAMYVRTRYGIGVSYSNDRGKTWSEGEDSTLGGPCSRFCIRRLKSGRVLLVNHCNFTGRNNLTALLSEDDGKTWRYRLLLDERDSVSYPDLKEADDGYIYIVYDRERGGFLNSLNAALGSAREILYAKITEQDIMAGELVGDQSKLKSIAHKLGVYTGEDKDPYNENK